MAVPFHEERPIDTDGAKQPLKNSSIWKEKIVLGVEWLGAWFGLFLGLWRGKVVPFLDEKMPVGVKNAFLTLATEHRTLFVCLFLMPISVLYDIFRWAKRWYQYEIKQSRLSHKERIAFVQKQIQDSAVLNIPMCTARPTYMAMSLKDVTYKNRMAPIDVSALDNVLDLNEENQTVYVEPNCTMGQITRELIPRGWTLAVTPELDDLTVGGLINGFGIETSSHLYGLFQHTCTAFEIVMPNGELKRATATENPELFAAIPWSHGTLGFLVGAEIKVTGLHRSLDTMVAVFTAASRAAEFDFVESLQYSKDKGVVMIGKMITPAHAKKMHQSQLANRPTINAIGRWWKPWFFKHVESFLNSSRQPTDSVLNRKELSTHLRAVEFLSLLYRNEFHLNPSSNAKKILPKFDAKLLSQDLIPLRDYYHRHTRAIFWELQDIIPFANEWWFRCPLGWAVPPHISLLKLTTWGKLKEVYEKAHVIQDMLVPINTLRNSILKFHQELKLYPLWLCPMRLLSPPTTRWLNKQPLDVDPPLSLPGCSQEFVDVFGDSGEYPYCCPLPGGFVAPTVGEQLYVDIGAYGIPRAAQWKSVVEDAYKIKFDVGENDEDGLTYSPVTSNEETHVRVMRRVEKYVRDNHGYQALYADCFQTRPEFREMFNHGLLDKLRKKYGCHGRLPEVFDKMCRAAQK